MKHKSFWLLLAAIPFALTACGTAANSSTSDSSDNTATAVASDSVEYGEVTLGEYKGLSAEKSIYEITQDDIDAAVESLLYDYVEYNDVDRAAQADDYVTVNMTASVDGSVILDYSSEEYEILIGAAEFGEELDSKMTGVVAGDKLNFSITYDLDFEDGDLAGNTVDYDITVIGITEEVFPELTEEFIQESLEYESYDAMVAALTAELAEENDSSSEYELRENLMLQVINASTITSYSSSLYESYAASLNESYASYAEMFGYDNVEDIYELFGMTEADVEQEVLDQVYRTVVVHAICEAENITLSDEEYEEGLAYYTEENEYDSAEDMIADYGEESVRAWILEDKVLDLIEENATITENTIIIDR